MSYPHFTCPDCGHDAPRFTAKQIFCRPCSARRDTERKARWSKDQPKKPRTPEQQARAVAIREAKRARGAARAGDGSPVWLPGAIGGDLLWTVSVNIPFSYALSKNAVWSFAGRGRGGHVFMREKAGGARATVRAAMQRALGGRPCVEAKMYIDIFVQKPDHRGDAINVLDSICDGVKDAVGIDDRWFCVRGLDWEIVKHGDPRIWIRVGQATTEHHRVCSYCGRILPFAAYTKATHGHLGRGRECAECRAAITSAARATRATEVLP